MDDDVIPYEQSHVLATKLTNADVHVHITGLYGHTGAHRPPLSALGKELITMFSPTDGLHHTCEEVSGGTCLKLGALCAP